MLACAGFLGGCTTSPTTGRAQFNILPGALETTVPDLRFDVKTMLASSGEFCKEEDAGPETPCAPREQAEQLSRRIAPIAERLGAVTSELSPELATRVSHVEVFIIPNDSVSVTSSAGGKIAVGSGLARLNLSDTDLALALAREFGRLASAHHRESTSAGLAVSLVTSSPLVGAYVATSFLADLLFPMGALFKVGISLIGSMGTEQLVELSQQGEADEFAGKLLIAAGYDLHELAESRPEAAENTAKLGWLPAYLTSRAVVAGMAPHSATMAKIGGETAQPPTAMAEEAVPGNAAGQAAQTPSPPVETNATVDIKADDRNAPQEVVAAPAPDTDAPKALNHLPATETSEHPAGIPTSSLNAPSAGEPPPPPEARIADAAPAAVAKAATAKTRLQFANMAKTPGTAARAKPEARNTAVKKTQVAAPKPKPAVKQKPAKKNQKNIRKPPPKQP